MKCFPIMISNWWTFSLRSEEMEIGEVSRNTSWWKFNNLRGLTPGELFKNVYVGVESFLDVFARSLKWTLDPKQSWRFLVLGQGLFVRTITVKYLLRSTHTAQTPQYKFWSRLSVDFEEWKRKQQHCRHFNYLRGSDELLMDQSKNFLENLLDSFNVPELVPWIRADSSVFSEKFASPKCTLVKFRSKLRSQFNYYGKHRHQTYNFLERPPQGNSTCLEF